MKNIVFSLYLRKDGKLAPEVMQPNIRDSLTINYNLTSRRLNQPEQGHSQRGFTSPCSTNYAHLVMGKKIGKQ